MRRFGLVGWDRVTAAFDCGIGLRDPRWMLKNPSLASNACSYSSLYENL